MRSILVLLLLVSPLSELFACKCAGRIGKESAAWVFAGTVVATRVKGSMQITKWKVEKTYKGAEEEYITFRSAYTSCSKAFVVGKRYIIYAYERESTRKEARFATGRCTHTAEIGDVPVEEIELQSDSGGEL